MRNTPRYLKGHEDQYKDSPRAAALAWFREARVGLFLHYGLYSLLGGVHGGRDVVRKGGEWIRWAAPVPFGAYAKLADDFTAASFDADAICDLALEAGMRYVNLTAQHHDGFCLWPTDTCDFHVMNTPAKRDLVGELVGACDRKGLGCFLYYSHGRDWWHPHSPDPGIDRYGFNSCRPNTIEDRAHFKHGDAVELDRYLDFVEAQVMQLCARYHPVAGIWLDGIGSFKHMEDGVARSRAQELYDRIHASRPQILVSYKQGLTGTEDFFAPERGVRRAGDGAVTSQAAKPYEICTTLQPDSWGYKIADDGRHHGPDWVLTQLAEAAAIPANLLLNTGPKGDGSIPEEDVQTLREVGRRLAAQAVG